MPYKFLNRRETDFNKEKKIKILINKEKLIKKSNNNIKSDCF
jgi:hypothetical protein